MARPIVAVVDLAAIAANVARARQLAAGAEVLAVVKANAYGHGLQRVLPALAGADGLALVELEAALSLRAAGYAKPILLLEGFFEARELVPIADAALGIVVHDAAQIRMLETASLTRPLDVYVKVNAGMNRLGIAPADVASACERLARLPTVEGLRLMMHFARSDEEDGIAEARTRFERACAGLPYPRSLANSAGVVRFPEVGDRGRKVRRGHERQRLPRAHRRARLRQNAGDRPGDRREHLRGHVGVELRRARCLNGRPEVRLRHRLDVESRQLLGRNDHGAGARAVPRIRRRRCVRRRCPGRAARRIGLGVRLGAGT